MTSVGLHVPSDERGIINQAIHPQELARFLGAQLPSFDPSRAWSAHFLTGGRSNVTVKLMQGSHAWVLRRPPLGHVMTSAHDVGREFAVLSKLATVGFPAPTPRIRCADPTIIGSPFYIMDFVPGVVFATPEQTAKLTPAERTELSYLHVSTIARLHAVDTTAAGLADLARPGSYLQRQVNRWARQWETTKTRDLIDMSRLGAWLDDNVGQWADRSETVLVHGDYRLDNLIISPVDLSVAAVLDWEMSTLGDPIADLAVALVYWTQETDSLRRQLPVARDLTSALGFYDRSQYVQAYARLTGRSLDQLDFCIALACFKLAVIMESIRHRTLAGQQLHSDTKVAAQMASGTETLASIGMLATAGSGIAAIGA